MYVLKEFGFLFFKAEAVGCGTEFRIVLTTMSFTKFAPKPVYEG